MGTLLETFNSVRLRIKDQYKNEFTNADLLIISSEVLTQVQDQLAVLESNLVMQPTKFDTVANVDTYTVTGLGSIIYGGVWIDKEYPLSQLVMPIEDVTTDNSQPTFYRMLADGSMLLYPTPDQGYTVTVVNTTAFTEPTEATLDTYDIPWQGIWNKAVMRAMVVECLTILERSVYIAAVQAEDAWSAAVQATYAYGMVKRTRRGGMFDGL